jgi:hypothetical protein
MKDRIYDDIFKVIEHVDKHHPLLKLKKEYDRRMVNSNKSIKEDIDKYSLPGTGNDIEVKNGKLTLYRGENHYFKECVANIYRDRSLEKEDDLMEIAVDRIKISDFKQILLHFPQIKKAISDKYYVDFKAIAQHYGLRTSYIDLTSDIATGLFFASTINIDSHSYKPITNGYGYLRGYVIKDLDNNMKMRSIGLQPFLRPTRQDAFVYEARLNEDLNKTADFIIKFKQTELNYIFYMLCETPVKGMEKLWPEERQLAYFPNEPDIINASNYMIITNSLTLYSVKKYCIRNNENLESFIIKLNKKGYKVDEESQFDINSIDIDRANSEIEERLFEKGRIFSFDHLPTFDK